MHYVIWNSCPSPESPNTDVATPNYNDIVEKLSDAYASIVWINIGLLQLTFLYGELLINKTELSVCGVDSL